ncbi:MAG: hypothetical protein KUG69_12450 [Marinosulfonomonas sp.]|nr:hypothetical protein [Marinosulfonomonas sp.]
MELSLHLGAHRTGTSALQQACRNNAGRLADANIEVWDGDVMRAPALERFPNIWPGDLSDANKKSVDGAVSAMQDAIQQRIDGGRAQLLVTEENLLGSMPQNLLAQSLYPNAAKRMLAYSQLFPVPPARIFVCLRSYASYWASCYCYAALRNDLPDIKGSCDNLVQAPRGWLDVLTDLSAVFPDSRIVVWEHRKTADILKDVVAMIFGPVAQRMDLPKNLKNRALNAVAFEKAMHLHKNDPELSGSDLQDAVAALDKAGGASFQPFSGAQVNVLNARFAADLKKIAAGELPRVDLIENSPPFAEDAP